MFVRHYARPKSLFTRSLSRWKRFSLPEFRYRQIVTLMLSSVVAVTQNSSRVRQSAQSKGLVGHGLPATALPSRHPLLTGHASPMPGFLIANPELEFPASCCEQRSELFSNRKFSAVLRSPQRIPDPTESRGPGTVSVVPLFSSSLQNLIETPRLESPATPTKQTSESLSNRDKNPLFDPDFKPPARSFHLPELSYNDPTQTDFLTACLSCGR